MKFKLNENRKEIITDTLTPVSIYLKLRDNYSNTILLESSDYSAKDNSYAYICCNPIAKFYQWQLSSGALDGWTSYHLAAGLFIAKVAQWLGATDFWAVMWVVIIGVAWEIFEVYVEGTEETYGTKERWAWNTGTDLFVEIAAAWWMVL